jgi:hypothetical protein
MKRTFHKFSVVLLLSVLPHAASAFNPDTFAYPGANTPECAATPIELATKPDIIAAARTFGSLDRVAGNWKLTGIPLVKRAIAFTYDNFGFYVQNGNLPPQKASLCSYRTANGRLLLRVSLHKPYCPENRNIYIQALSEEEMAVTAYATQRVGTVRFKRNGSATLPVRGIPEIRCAFTPPNPV